MTTRTGAWAIVAILAGAAMGCTERAAPADAGGGLDARTALDAALAPDADATEDAALPIDAAAPIDAAPPIDAATTTDAAVPTEDASTGDGGAIVDGGADASAPADASTLDASTSDAAVVDAAITDAAITDAATTDATTSDGGLPCMPLPATGSLTIPAEFTTTDATWNRPDDVACPAALDTTQLYYVDTFVLCETGAAAGSYRIRLDSSEIDPSLTLYDPYLVVYAGTSIPADATMCVALNDDEAAGTTYASEIPTLSVAPGSAITIAATSFDYIGPDGYELGTYRVVITRL